MRNRSSPRGPRKRHPPSSAQPAAGRNTSKAPPTPTPGHTGQSPTQTQDPRPQEVSAAAMTLPPDERTGGRRQANGLLATAWCWRTADLPRQCRSASVLTTNHTVHGPAQRTPSKGLITEEPPPCMQTRYTQGDTLKRKMSTHFLSYRFCNPEHCPSYNEHYYCINRERKTAANHTGRTRQHPHGRASPTRA